MSNNEESLYSQKIKIEQRIKYLNKVCEDSSKSSISEKEQIAALLETLATNLNLIKKGIKIGILKKIATMDLETLQSIAIRSLSIFSEGINPDVFISEYERLKNKQKIDLEEFEKGQKEELKKRRELAPSLEYELRGPAYAFVDINGNPRTNLIIEDKQLEILKAQVKKDPNTRKILKVKVPKDFFTDDELLKLGPKYHNGVSENVEVLKPIHLSKEEMHELYPIISQRHAAFLSFIKKRPENALLSEEELRDKYQQDLCRFKFIIKITPDIRRKERFDYKYHSSAKPQENVQINQMGIILPEVIEKQKLLSDIAHLKRCVQELLVGSEFFNWYSSIDKNNPNYQVLQQLILSPITTFFSEEEFNSIINPIISAKSVASSQQLFGDSKDINRYRDYLNRVKKENKAQAKEPYSNQLLTTEQCDKQLEVLKELEQKQANPISQGSFKL